MPDEEDDEPENKIEKSASSLTNSQSQHTHRSSSDCGSFFVFPEESVLEKAKQAKVPLVAAIKIIDGSVEDVAFGVFAHTDAAWFGRNTYVKNDSFGGPKLLVSFKEDPLRFVSIKWATRDFAAFVPRRSVHRVSRSTRTANACTTHEHSVELDDCPVHPDRYNVVRLNLSICYIMRPVSDTQIEVYARGYADMGGNLPLPEHQNLSISKFA